MRTVQVRVQPGARPQFEYAVRLVERPDAGERCVEMFDQPLGAPLEHRSKFVALNERLTDRRIQGE